MKSNIILTSARLPLAVLLTLLLANGLWAQKIRAIEAMTVEADKGGASKKFEELLDTKDLSKFRGYQTEEIPEGWTVQGKNLIFDGTGKGDIITRDTFKDFELQVEWSVEKGGNSGIMFRVTLGDSEPYISGPEIQILDDENHGDGKNELTSAGSLYGLYAPNDKKLNGPGKWNKSRIIVQNGKVTHYLNGVKVLEAEFGSEDWNQRLANSKFKSWEKFNQAQEGHIAFQNHGDPVKFRAIRVKRLGSDTDPDAESDSDSDSDSGSDAAAAPPAESPGTAGAPGGFRRGGAVPEDPTGKGGRKR
jgi:hypothetical protein